MGIAAFQPFFETSTEKFDLQYNINVKPVFYLTQTIAAGLKDEGLPGSIVHISSQSATIPLDDHLVYSSSKAAVDHLARIQALELGKYNIRVNTVRPTVCLPSSPLRRGTP